MKIRLDSEDRLARPIVDLLVYIPNHDYPVQLLAYYHARSYHSFRCSRSASIYHLLNHFLAHITSLLISLVISSLIYSRSSLSHPFAHLLVLSPRLSRISSISSSSSPINLAQISRPDPYLSTQLSPRLSPQSSPSPIS